MRCPEFKLVRMLAPMLAPMLAVAALAGAPASALAVGQVAGPVEIGPSWAQAQPAQSTAVLSTVLVNHGGLADRLIRVECPASGHVALRNGTLHQQVMAPNPAQAQDGQQRYGDQNGLDLPPAVIGGPHPVTAIFDLNQATQPLTEGALVPCALYFAHDGQRIVIFTVGLTPKPTQEP
jgi:copper(I)-binding protein